MLKLAPAIEQFIQAHNTQDNYSGLHYFDPDAVVLAQNQIWVGHAAIKRWHQQWLAQQPLEIIGLSHHYGECYLHTRLQNSTAHHKGYQFVFALQDGRISRLIVTPEH